MPPIVKLSRPAFFCLALILLVFAFWALPDRLPVPPIPVAMNVVSKILAFVTALSLSPSGSRGGGEASRIPASSRRPTPASFSPKLRNGDSAANCRPPGTRSGRAALDGETGYGGAQWTRTSAIG